MPTAQRGSVGQRPLQVQRPSPWGCSATGEHGAGRHALLLRQFRHPAEVEYPDEWVAAGYPALSYSSTGLRRPAETTCSRMAGMPGRDGRRPSPHPAPARPELGLPAAIRPRWDEWWTSRPPWRTRRRAFRRRPGPWRRRRGSCPPPKAGPGRAHALRHDHGRKRLPPPSILPGPGSARVSLDGHRCSIPRARRSPELPAPRIPSPPMSAAYSRESCVSAFSIPPFPRAVQNGCRRPLRVSRGANGTAIVVAMRPETPRMSVSPFRRRNHIRWYESPFLVRTIPQRREREPDDPTPAGHVGVWEPRPGGEFISRRYRP